MRQTKKMPPSKPVTWNIDASQSKKTKNFPVRSTEQNDLTHMDASCSKANVAVSLRMTPYFFEACVDVWLVEFNGPLCAFIGAAPCHRSIGL